ncbi:MAG: beta-propeller domain-containing protein [Clostridia bacterium]|nr:beta-propeller domain-containing protein [Clostridia bacterium]
MRRIYKLVCALTAALMILTSLKLSGTEAYSKPLPVAERLKNSIVLYVGSSQALVKNTEVQVDPSNPEVKPLIVEGRTLVPVSFISQSLGAKVIWDGKTSTVKVNLGAKSIKLALGSKKMTVNGNTVTIDVAARSRNGRTFIPLSALATALGKKVFYDRGLIIISDIDNIFDRVNEKTDIDGIISRVNNLPVVGSYETLKKLMDQIKVSNGYYVRSITKGGVALEENVFFSQIDDSVSVQKAEQASPTTGAATDYSTTNVQVQGVDEADVVKTDGQYIYQVNKQRIVIARAYPADAMKIESILNFAEKNIVPQELYLHGNSMVVIGTTYNSIAINKQEVLGDERKIAAPAYTSVGTVKAIIYDITDKKNIKQVREVEVEGSYVSSRKLGATLYLVANRYLDVYYTQDNQGSDVLTPYYRDTAVKGEFVNIDYANIRYFPGCINPNYMVVAGVNLDKATEPASVSTYLGAGQNIYASQQNMYVAVTNYKYTEIKPSASLNEEVSNRRMAILPMSETNTLVYKFSLSDSKVTYISKGEVPGTILNQFSMDENGKYFRIATTKGEIWRTDEYTSKNNVYILDEMLNITGKLEDIAPGEKIYSVRFMGDRGYVVTFKTVDPLFVIDLKNPTSPKILGALKIPGYSDYLHPYDETHIIGFGKDTVEVAQKDWEGKPVGTTAFYLGMKLAIFDVSDVANPKEMFSEKIGDRGTDSPLLRNHKALLFSKDKNLLAFPVTVMEVSDKDKISGGDLNIPEYGQFKFQGAYVYDIDLTRGFTMKGKITHLSEDDYTKSGSYYYGSDKTIDRIIYIGDKLYTLSNAMIKANSISDLKEVSTLEIP